MSSNPSYRSGYRGRQMDYRTGYTSWDRQQPEPGHLREYEDDGMMGQMTHAGGSVVHMIQRNPIPAALAGLGAGWFLMRRRGSQHGDQPYYYRPGRHTTVTGGYRSGYDSGYQGGYGYQAGQSYPSYQGATGYESGWQQTGDEGRGRMSEMAGEVREGAGQMMHRAQDMGGDAIDQVSQFRSQAMEQVSHLPDQAGRQVQNLRGTYEQKMQDNPLLMGAVALGLGLAVGMMIPETKKENQLLGERRDQMLERAQELAGEAVDRVQDVAQEAAHAATETAKEEAQRQGKEMSQGVTTGSQPGSRSSTSSATTNPTV